MGIRKARAADLRRMLTVIRKAHERNRQQGIYFHTGQISWSKLKGKFKREVMFVAVEGQQVVGTISLKQKGTSMKINTLAVLPAHQSKGYGKQLIRYAEQYANERGRSTFLYTIEDHTWLSRFYKKLGYRRVKVRRGKKYKVGKYVKRLPEAHAA